MRVQSDAPQTPLFDGALAGPAWATATVRMGDAMPVVMVCPSNRGVRGVSETRTPCEAGGRAAYRLDDRYR